MLRFITGFLLGITLGIVIGINVGWAQKAKDFEGYILQCEYQDRVLELNVRLASFPENFPEKLKEETLVGTCQALKAMRECDYMKNKWEKNRKLGVKIYTQGVLTIQYSDSPGFCGWTIPMLERQKIYLTKDLYDGVIGCGTIGQVIFHESLHLVGLPDHNYELPRYKDEIEKAVYMCMTTTEGERDYASTNWKGCNTNERSGTK